MLIKRAIKFFSIFFGFFLFGFGGLLFSLYLPIKAFFSKERHRYRFYQRNIHDIFRVFVSILVKLNIFDIEVRGAEKIKKINNELLVTNHPSLMDVVFLVSILPEVTCIVKPMVWHNPFMRTAVRGAEYIKSDDTGKFIQQCSKIITQFNRSILIFPEGTRTFRKSTLNQFKRGFANIVYQQDIMVRPIIISMNPRFLCKEDKWYNVPRSVVKVTIEIDDALNVQDWYFSHDSRAIAVRKIKEEMYQYFLKRVEHSERFSKRSKSNDY